MTAYTETEALTGSDLRLMRYARRVTSTALARRYGVTRARISNLEAMERPTRDAIARYLRALGEATKDR